MQASGKGSIWIALMVVLLLLSGCGAGGAGKSVDSGGATGTDKGTTDTQGAASTDSVRIIEHVLGKTEIKGTPKRIVTLYNGANDVMIAYGIKPVGIVESHGTEPVYDYLKKDLAGIPTVGLETQPSLEEIYNLKPDVIIATRFRNEATYQQLSEIAPTVAVNEVYEWKETVKLIGQVLNQEDKGTQLLADWDRRVADFRTKMGDRLPIKASIVNFRADHARIYYMGYAGKILKELGFTRPPAQEGDQWGVKVNSKESIPDMNADTLFVFNSGKDPAAIEKNVEAWTRHPLWKNLDAYKKNSIFKVDEVNWNLAGGYLSANRMLDDLYKMYDLKS
ncbi:iron-siderophore ABC transporter substrate-binding protein [Paenibacillus sp. 28ISP30-2]|uniref:ABC transporter substrate-binding protein n=1 Tax=Paenibacillus TaxID=44249 RepID=UPI0011EADAD1|nr:MULTISPECIES: iron-siderophore ABC transporter substrate-binding protein [Paenibacillus]MBE0338265.1 iron-siderophore ABC transporter substrate-binding protein [Paenibacillus sp. 23TSA30-6]MBE0342510.1 iron-siderophore ABC transporter substrate-binding protein [Paenibacillus sp. 28ISP30-2]